MGSTNPAITQLAGHQFLAFFDEENARKLANSAELSTLKSGDLIFREGEGADSIKLVVKGVVRLTKLDSEGKEQLLAFVRENEFFGEFGVLDGKPRSASAYAGDDGTVLASLPRDAVIGVFNQSGVQGVMKIALHIVGKLRTINERYVEERLRKERMTLIGEMADCIIHDLRSPFCVIQIVTDLLRRSPPADLTEYCDMVEAQIARVQHMVEEILDFSRGKPQLKLESVSMEDILGRFKSFNQAFLAKLQVELVTGTPPVVIEADGDKIFRVFQNIVNNAVEAFGGDPGRLEIRVEEAGEALLIDVKDNGPGIPEAMRASMFQPFSTMGKAKGNGLGMAITKSIVEAHGGTIAFTTANGQGTTFHIQLPRKR